MEFKDKLKKLRIQKGFTQEQLANALNVPESTIRRYEVMSGTPKRERLELIADYFNVSVDYLIGRDAPVEELSRKDMAKKMIEAIDSGLTNEEIEQRMDFFADILKLNPNQVNEFMNFVRWQLRKEQPAASKSDEQ